MKFSDHDNFHNYTQAKQDFEMGQFFTPAPIAQRLVEMLEIEPGKKVADLCCGSGQFFNFLKGCELTGIEAEKNAFTIVKKLYPAAKVQHTDIREMKSIEPQDYIVGNPPFNLLWQDERHPLSSQAGKLLSQDYWLKACHDALLPGGFLAFICPQTHLEDELRHSKVRGFIKKHFHIIWGVSLPTTAFADYGVKNFATKMLCFQKKVPGRELECPLYLATYEQGIQHWRNSETYSPFLLAKWQANAFQLKYRFTAFLAAKQKEDAQRKEEGRYRKLLFDLKRVHPSKVAWAENEYHRIGTEVKPAEMKWEVWQEKRPTLEKLFPKMKKCLRPGVHQDTVRLIKTAGEIRLKPLSWQAKRALTQANLTTSWNLHTLTHADYWKADWDDFVRTMKYLHVHPLSYRTKERALPIAFEGFSVQRFLRRKQQNFRHQRKAIASLPVLPQIKERLEAFRFGDRSLLPHQVEDVAKALGKPCALLNWEMGTGKTLAALAWALMRGGRTLVVAPSLLIGKTWKEELAASGLPDFCSIERWADLETARGKEFVLISLERIPKYSNRLKGIPFDNLIVDESDNIKNPASTRAKALKAVARKIPCKLLLTGTFTRNNATEAYNQLELLFNNSTAFLCEVPSVTDYDYQLRKVVTNKNPRYQLPYCAKGGLALFRKNFSPKKTTVFGAEKTNQELYNKRELERLLQMVRLRRRFVEIKPDNVTYDLRQITVPMTPSEKKVYQYLFDEFVQILRKQFAQNHDSRTSNLLVLMRQIMALLQAVSHPWTFPAYDGPEVTSKMERVREIVRKSPGKKIMFGSPWKPTAQKYAQVLAREFSVVHLESELPIAQRNELITQFRSGSAQVLVSTIGVLKAGVNIPEAEIVIADSYPWNFAQLSQYFFRAIRLNAANHTQVFCLSNAGSFDTNVFNLLLAKERINGFIQDGTEQTQEELAEGFGVNADMLQSAIQLAEDEVNGQTQTKVTWGESILTAEQARGEG